MREAGRGRGRTGRFRCPATRPRRRPGCRGRPRRRLRRGRPSGLLRAGRRGCARHPVAESVPRVRDRPRQAGQHQRPRRHGRGRDQCATPSARPSLLRPRRLRLWPRDDQWLPLHPRRVEGRRGDPGGVEVRRGGNRHLRPHDVPPDGRARPRVGVRAQPLPAPLDDLGQVRPLPRVGGQTPGHQRTELLGQRGQVGFVVHDPVQHPDRGAVPVQRSAQRRERRRLAQREDVGRHRDLTPSRAARRYPATVGGSSACNGRNTSDAWFIGPSPPRPLSPVPRSTVS
ncbi:hypothetical protein SVIOM74S_04047 [Streptomyces violarus]